jgi:tetratricopeptide (TPR) repeat protein
LTFFRKACYKYKDMVKSRYHSKYISWFRRKWAVRTFGLMVFAAAAVSLILLAIVKISGNQSDRKELRRLWEASSFEKAYAESGERLSQKPLDYFLLTLRGFSAYQLAAAQINNSGAIAYTDDCIWSLRKAMLINGGRSDGGLFYVLGKAYYDKGAPYADLSVRYMEKAGEAGYPAGDIPQYLGLAYAALGDYRSSVEAFSRALRTGRPSDLLFLSIAKSYRAMDEHDEAGAYLVRCLEVTKDSVTAAAARLLLGGILAETGDTAGAEIEFLKVIEEGGANAEAHYQLGELYAAGGDPVRARAEWQKAAGIDPAHRPSRARLNS